MSKSQARRKPAVQAHTPAKPWGWFLGGFFLGAFSLFLALLSGLVPDPRLADSGTQPAAGKETAAASRQQPQEKQQYSFYTRLPESEVIPPRVDEYDPGTAREDVRYLLQAASFRRHADADELRARLALLGIETSIQKVGAGETEQWYRVQAGPFLSKREVSSVRKKLQDARLDPLVLQVKP